MKNYIPLLMAVIAAFGIIIGMRLQESFVTDGFIKSNNGSNLSALSEALQHIESKYYGEFDKEVIADELISSLVDKLDPYSYYFSPDKTERYEEYIAGREGGIGIEILQIGDSLYIVDILHDSPADKAQIPLGSVLLAVDDTSVIGEEALSKIKIMNNYGVGDTMQISYLSPTNELIKKTLIPEVTTITLLDEVVIDSTTIYISIDRFYDGVYKDFMKVFDQNNQGRLYDGLILDLRSNPGGLLDESIKILNQFFRDKQLKIVSSIDANGKTKDYLTNGRSFLNLKRIVILTNDDSASASEVVAGCLQDYKKAVIIGDTTYGKGLIQQRYTLSNMGKISFTTGAYTLPKGRILHPYLDSLPYTHGVAPDVLVETSCESGEDIRSELMAMAVENHNWSLTADQWLSLFKKTSTAANACDRRYDEEVTAYVMDIIDEPLTWSQLKSNDPIIEEAYEILKSSRYDSILQFDR